MQLPNSFSQLFPDNEHIFNNLLSDVSIDNVIILNDKKSFIFSLKLSIFQIQMTRNTKCMIHIVLIIS